MRRRRIPWVAGTLAVLASVSGCGSGGSVPGVTQTVTVTKPPAALPPAKTGELPPQARRTTSASASFRMPNLVGLNLQLAQDKLQSLGSYVLDQEDAAGLSRIQVNDANWQVCQQNPVSGKKVSVETVVRLSSVKLTEQCP